MLTSMRNVNIMKLRHENVYYRSLWHTFKQTLFLIMMIDKTMLSYSNRWACHRFRDISVVKPSRPSHQTVSVTFAAHLSR